MIVGCKRRRSSRHEVASLSSLLCAYSGSMVRMFIATRSRRERSSLFCRREERILRKRRAGLLVLIGLLLLTLGVGVALAQGGDTATAQLEDIDGNPVGDAAFTEGPNGVTNTGSRTPKARMRATSRI